MSVTVGLGSNGGPLTWADILGGSGCVRGRLIALAPICGSHCLHEDTVGIDFDISVLITSKVSDARVATGGSGADNPGWRS